MRRNRFVHLSSLPVAVLLGHDFLTRTGIAIDVASESYGDGPLAPLTPFTPPPVATATPSVEATLRMRMRKEESNSIGFHAQPATLDCSTVNEVSGDVREIRSLQDNAMPVNTIFALLRAYTAGGDAIPTLPPLSGSLSESEQVRLTLLLTRFEAMFTKHPGCTNLVQHQIDTGDAVPWKCNP